MPPNIFSNIFSHWKTRRMIKMTIHLWKSRSDLNNRLFEIVIFIMYFVTLLGNIK